MIKILLFTARYVVKFLKIYKNILTGRKILQYLLNYKLILNFKIIILKKIKYIKINLNLKILNYLNKIKLFSTNSLKKYI